MSTTLGKSAGIALLLAAGLMLALYAAGVFTAQPASADGHKLTALEFKWGEFHASPVVQLTPVFDPDSDRNDYELVLPVPGETTTPAGGAIRITATANRSNSSTVMLTASPGVTVGADTDTADWRTVNVIQNDPAITQDLTGTLVTITSSLGDQSRVYRVRLSHAGEITDSTTAGATVKVTLQATTTVRVNDSIVLGMTGFGLPDEIKASDVLVDDGENSAQPTDVSVSGSNVTITMGKLKSTEVNSAPDNVIDNESITITIASRAGVKNPNKAGTYLVTMDSKDTADRTGVDARFIANVERKITVTPKSAGKSADVTVKGTGFSDGDAQVFKDDNGNNRLDADEDVLGVAKVTDGSFSFTTSSITENTTIQVVDFNGEVAIEGKAFTIKASIKVTPSEVSPAENVTVELVDWTSGTGLVTAVRFGGSSGQVVDVRSQNADANGEKITVPVPATARLGSLKVEALVGNTSKASHSVTVRAHELTISPTNAVPGQEITIQGSGFGNGTRIDGLTFGDGANVYASTADGGKPTADTNGNITITVNVPKDVKPGSREVKATGQNNRIGTASLTVPKPTLTVNPTESLRGTTVTLTGTGFTASDSVQIKYDRSQAGTVSPQVVTSAVVSSTGNFTKTFDVPSYARIGQTSKITVSSQLNEITTDNPNGFADVTVDHKTPKPAITLSPETAAAGSTISISGINFAGFAPIAELMIGDRDVKPVPTPATNNSGAITMDGILVPQLDAGSHTVKLKIGDQTVTKFIMVTDAPVSTAPADVFEPLVEAENLTVVWHYDNATGTWTSYSPTVPAELNDLETVATGTIVWVQVSEATTFQGKSLVAGWNLITLN